LEIRRPVDGGVRGALPVLLKEEWVVRYGVGGLVDDDDDDDDDDGEDDGEDGEDGEDDQEEDTGFGASDSLDEYLSYEEGGDSDEDDLDFTACSADDCGYCGRCTY
jgi:hypothetical protein